MDSKDVIFVTSKNLDYIRNTQEIKLLEDSARSLKVIGTNSSNYFYRIIYTYIRLSQMLFTKYDYIFVGFAPQLYLPFLYVIKREKLIIDFFISVYDTMVDDRKKIKPNSHLAKVVHQIDKLTIKRSQYAVCDTKAHRDYFIDEFNEECSKFLVIYIVADTSIYKPSINRPCKNTNDKLEVLYFGSILPLQGIDVVLEATVLLRDKDISFTIIGPIDGKLHVNKKEYTNVKFISWLTQEDLAYKIGQADLCLAGHFNGEIGKADRTIAGKTYIYQAMNKPIILGKSSANRELFKQNEMTMFVERGNPKDLSKCILEYSLIGGLNEINNNNAGL